MVEETGKGFLGHGKVVAREDLAQNVAIGAARVVDIVEAGLDAVEFAERGAEGAHASAARGEESAVDVPEQKSFHVKLNVPRCVTELRI